jgi:nicotinamide riboside kinase
MVEETGRELVPNSSDFSMELLQTVCRVHAARIRNAVEQLNPIVLIDTDVYTTQSYSMLRFGRYLDLGELEWSASDADLRFYLHVSAPFVQDGTRLHSHLRSELDKIHYQTLQAFSQDYMVIHGSWQERLSQIQHLIQKKFDALAAKLLSGDN